jgi:tetratricopeptide (TPR) repeat protein
MIRPLVVAAILFGIGSFAIAQEVDRSKVETLAAGQAAEADRLFKLGEWEQAMALYEAERVSRSTLGDLRYEAYANRAIGICKANIGDDEGAIEALGKARTLDVKREDKGYAGYDLFLIAQAEARLDRVNDAIKTLDIALPMLSTAIDRDHETDARLFLTRILLNVGQAEQAKPHVARALVLSEELKDSLRIADSWAASGQIEGALGNLSLALERFADAEEQFEQDGRAGEAAWMETIAGSTLALMGRPDLSLARFEEAARRHEHLEDFGSLSEDLAAVAGLLIETNRVDEALEPAKKAVEKAQEIDDRPREIEARVRLSQVQGLKNDWKSAAETLDEAVLLVRQVARDDPGEQIRVILTAGSTDQRAGLDAKAVERFQLAEKIADDSKIPALKQVVRDYLSQIRIKDKGSIPPKPPG